MKRHTRSQHFMMRWCVQLAALLLHVCMITSNWPMLRVHAGQILEATPENEHIVMQAVEYYNQAQRANTNGLTTAAITLYQQAIDTFPNLTGAYNNMAMLYLQRGNASYALDILHQGAEVANATMDYENLAAMHNNIGYILRERNRKSFAYALEAIAHYDLAIQAFPDGIDAMYNKASALYAMRQYDQAQALYARVLERDPAHIGAHMDMGAIYFAHERLKEAIFHQDQIIQIGLPRANQREILGAYNNKGQFLKDQGALLDALATHEAALAFAPTSALALANVVTAKRTLCQWYDIESLQDRLLHQVAMELQDPNTLPAVGVSLLPYDSTLLRIPDDIRRRIAIAHAKTLEQLQTLELPPQSPTRSTAKLTIGYLSFDFRAHPMGQLTLGALESQDHNRVSTVCFSYGPNDQSSWRLRAEQACDSFHDVRLLSDLEAARAIAQSQVDVLVDLMAHTRGGRLGIVALQPSRLIVNYLGFPGTMGASYTQFAMVDRYVVPVEVAASTMTEQLVVLPHSYQVNQYDLDLPIEERRRPEAYGLPSNRFVFCNFNTINKMEPLSFDVWMRILHRVPNSVLWLLEPGKPDDPNAAFLMKTLRQEALARGIASDRLLFAPYQSKNEHLVRLQTAELFLDSFIYNAHSTASDALWATVPLLTLAGDAFPSRVAASLLQNILPRDLSTLLIADSLKQYEDLAVSLATHHSTLMKLRQSIAASLLSMPLFDTKRMTVNMEDAYALMVETSKANGRYQLIVNPASSRQLIDPSFVTQRLNQAIDYGVALQQSAMAMDKREEQHETIQRAQFVYQRVLITDLKNANARHLLGLCDYQLKQYEEAQHELERAVALAPTVAFFHQNLGILYLAINETEKAITTFQHCLALDDPDHESHAMAFRKLLEIFGQLPETSENLTLQRQLLEASHSWFWSSDHVTDDEKQQVYLRFSYVLAQSGDILQAITLLRQWITERPTYFALGYNLAALLVHLQRYDEAEAQILVTVQAENQFQFTTSGYLIPKAPRPSNINRVIVFYCHEYGQTWWNQWGPLSVRQGLGGSEEAVVFLSMELANLGYHVEIYANPPAEEIGLAYSSRDSGGSVYWYPHTTFDSTSIDSIGAFVAWRYYISLALAPPDRVSKRFFWMHDVPTNEILHSQFLLASKPQILCVSRFQADQLPPSLHNQVAVTSNALDPAFFHNGHNDRNAFVYGSAPNRGLMTLLRAWPLIRSQLPSNQNITLTVYYGFTPAFMKWGARHLPNFDEWKQEMDSLLQQPDVIYKGLVSHNELARAYANAGFYLYPTTFQETSCVSLMKAMANGAIPITSRFPVSALSETCDRFDIGPLHFPVDTKDLTQDPVWLREYVEHVVTAWQQQEAMDAFRQEMKAFARQKYQWRTVAAQWHQFVST